MNHRLVLFIIFSLGIACFVGFGALYWGKQATPQSATAQTPQAHRIHDAAMEVHLSNTTDRVVWVYHSKSEPIDPLNLSDQQRKTVLELQPSQTDKITAQSHTQLGDEHITLPFVFWTVDPETGQATTRGPIALGHGIWELSIVDDPSTGAFSITTTQIGTDPEVPTNP